MWSEVNEALVTALRADPEVAHRLTEIEDRVQRGSLTPAAAARALLEAYRGVPESDD